tara:strand:- start:281 stop:694 length:414 start_codon:yes stop_codon:yes gene_type:complete
VAYGKMTPQSKTNNRHPLKATPTKSGNQTQTPTKLNPMKSKIERSKKAEKLTTKEAVNLIVSISSKKALLKSIQIKQLNEILEKSLEGFILAKRDMIRLLEMSSTIKCHLEYNTMNVISRMNKLEREPLTKLANNKL